MSMIERTMQQLQQEIYLSNLFSDGSNVWFLKSSNSVQCLVRYDGSVMSDVPIPEKPKSTLNNYGGYAIGVCPGGVWLQSKSCLHRYCLKSNSWFRVAVLDPNCQYGFGVWSDLHDAWVCVMLKYDHQSIVMIKKNQSMMVLAEGADFYSHPVINHKGTMRWVEWDHPWMSWDQSRLMEGDIIKNKLIHQRTLRDIKGVSYAYPAILNQQNYFISDVNGYYQVYKEDQRVSKTDNDCIHPVWFSQKEPFTVIKDKVYHLGMMRGQARLYESSKTSSVISDESLTVSELTSLNHEVYFIGKGTHHSQALFKYSNNKVRSIIKPTTLMEDLKPITIHHQEASSFLWWPGVLSEARKLIVKVHGGPTAMSSPELDHKRNFWLSNGYAYLEINYKGSSGFGRNYRQQLYGNWGDMDVDHCYEVMNEVKKSYPVKSIIMKGGSAGGMTALLIAAKYPLDIDAVSCYYPVLSKSSLIDTHRFELHYCRRLISQKITMPMDCIKLIKQPVFICHGALDKVVPMSDTKKFVEALSKVNDQVYFNEIPGEGHGFSNQENITKVLNLENQFFQQL